LKPYRIVIVTIVIIMLWTTLPVVESSAESPPWPDALRERGYASFLAPTTKRLNDVPAPTPADAVKTVSLTMARGETTSLQLGV